MQPPSVLLEGAAGSGKTFSLPTFINAGVELFVIGTEPGFAESLLDGAKYHKADLSKLHFATAAPVASGFDALDEMVLKIGTMDYESLTKIKSGIGKQETRQAAMGFLNQLKNFKDERSGKEFGSYTTWGPDRALVIDSLSGLSKMAWGLTVGYKPAAHQGEWGVAMNFIDELLMKITSDRNCFLCVTGHVEKEFNELTGAQQIMVSTLGRKLAPKIPRFFSEVVYAKRQRVGDSTIFTWSTIDMNADLKNRALPISDKLEPTFVPIVNSYNERVKAVASSVAATAADVKSSAA